MSRGSKLADREVLDRLIRYATLSPGEAKVFGRWHERLTINPLVALPPRDRLWVDAVYQDRGVGALRAAARAKARGAELAGKQAQKPSTWFEAMPLPKRPPGQ